MRTNQLVIWSYLASLSHDTAVTALVDAALSRMRSPLMTKNCLCRKRKWTASYSASETCTGSHCRHLAAKLVAIVIGIQNLANSGTSLPAIVPSVFLMHSEKCLRNNIHNLITFMTKWLKNIFNTYIIEIFLFICSQFRYWNLGSLVLIRKHG